MGQVGAVRTPPAFGHHVPVAYQHEAVHFDIGSRIERVEEREDRGWVDVLLDRRAPRQRFRHDRQSKGWPTWGTGGLWAAGPAWTGVGGYVVRWRPAVQAVRPAH